MNNNICRLRVFAGPNGSGKTTLIHQIQQLIFGKKTRMELGCILNADVLEEKLSLKPLLHLEEYAVNADNSEFATFLAHNPLVQKTRKFNFNGLYIKSNILAVKGVSINSYIAAIITEFLRKKLMLSGKSFSYETVMSHYSRVSFINDAKKKGYKTYLYFVATESPEINISRVKARMEKGGHGVSEGKIRQRYNKSIKLLKYAVKIADRSFVFDNSSELRMIASGECGHIMVTTNSIPEWFDHNSINS